MDCEPFVEAVSKMLGPYIADDLDAFKNSFSFSFRAKVADNQQHP